MAMSFLRRPCGATIRYSVYGDGHIPILVLAPGGMESSIDKWKNQPYDPIQKLVVSSRSSSFRVIAMDQRNATSQSMGPIGNGWETYRDDQLSLLDHLGIGQCLLLGSCIGPSYMFALLKHSPKRFCGGVMLQPIGLAKHTTEQINETWTGLNHDATTHWFGRWADGMESQKRFDRSELEQLHRAMFGPDRDFVFSVQRDDVKAMEHPLLVFMGKDLFHPAETAREIVSTAPNAELVEQWRDEDYSEDVDKKIENFLLQHGQ